MLWFMIKSYFLSSPHQNFFKFSTVIHCIILINMQVITSSYIFNYFLHICTFFQYLTQKNMAWEILSESLQVHYMDTVCTHTWCFSCIFRCVLSYSVMWVMNHHNRCFHVKIKNGNNLMTSNWSYSVMSRLIFFTGLARAYLGKM